MKQTEIVKLAPNADHMLCIVDPESGELLQPPLCEEVGVLKKVEDLLTGVMEIVMCLWLCGRMKRFTLKRSEFARKNALLSTLFDQGLSILDTDENTLSLINYIMDTDMAAPTEYSQKAGVSPT